MAIEYSPRGRAYQAFLTGAKSYLMDTLYPQVRAAVEAAAASRHDINGIAGELRGNASYEYFCWLEHYIQHFKYTARHGLLAEAEAQRGPLTSLLMNAEPGRLRLVPTDVPRYYSVVDTHQHPGNLHADLLAGPIYKASASSTQPGSTNAYQLHYRFADILGRHATEPRTVLDLGCGFGKSTLPIAEKWPGAAVDGIDISEGCLRLAAVEAAQHDAANLHYIQGDVVATERDAAAYDLVTSTMLLHELDNDALKAAMREAFRVLKPGGKLVQLDFRARHAPERFFLHGHGQRNNEPYMADFDLFDFSGHLTSLGFTDIDIEPFEESPGAADPEFAKWRLPWTVISARKPAGAVSGSAAEAS